MSVFAEVAYGTVNASLVFPPAVTVILLPLAAREGLAERLVAVVALSAVAAFPVISPGLTT
jgi:hypothetical protein